MAAGKIVYQGPAATAVDYFSAMGFYCPTYSTPSDYFLFITHHESKKNVENFPRFLRTYDRLQAPKVSKDIKSSSRVILKQRTFQVGFCRALGTLLWRDGLNTLRNPLILYSRVLVSIIFMLMAGAIFWKLDNDYSPGYAEASLTTRCSILFLLTLIFVIPFMTAATITFPLEKPIYLKESASKMYSLPSYFLSRNIVELPIIIIVPILSTLIIYWMVGFHHGATEFFLFMLISFLSCFCGTSLGLLAGSLFKNVIFAIGIVPTFTMPMLYLGGFLKNRADFSSWYGWLEYLSPFKYGFTAYSLNEFRGTTAPIELFNLNMSLALAIILLAVMSIVVRILSFVALMLKKDTL